LDLKENLEGGLEIRWVAHADRVDVESEGVFSASPAGYFVVGATGGAGIPAGGTTGAPGIGGTPTGPAGMPAGGAGIDWTGAAAPPFMMLRVPPVPEK